MVEGEAGFEGLERWAAEGRAREAAEARIRERWLRTQAEEDARLAQVLTGLAERRAEAVVTTTAGHQVPGRVTALGQDFLAVSGELGRTTLVPFTALAWVRPVGGTRRRSGLTLGPDAVDPGDPTSFPVGRQPRSPTCSATPSPPVPEWPCTPRASPSPVSYAPWAWMCS